MLEKNEHGTNCILCGEDTFVLDRKKTADGYCVCGDCSMKAALLDNNPKNALSNKKAYINSRYKEFFVSNIHQIKELHRRPIAKSDATSLDLIVNVSSRIIYSSLGKDLFSFDSVSRIETSPKKMLDKRSIVKVFYSEGKKNKIAEILCENDADMYTVEKRLNELLYPDSTKTDAENTSNIISNSSSNYGEIIELKKLLDADLITQEEFDMKKKQILGL